MPAFDCPDSAKVGLLACCDPKTLVALGAVNKSWQQVFKSTKVQQVLDHKASSDMVLYWIWRHNQTRGLQELNGSFYPSSAGGRPEPFLLLEEPLCSERPCSDFSEPMTITLFATVHDIRCVKQEQAEYVVSGMFDEALLRIEADNNYLFEDFDYDLEAPTRIPTYVYYHARPSHPDQDSILIDVGISM
jgi:hypothetical protein